MKNYLCLLSAIILFSVCFVGCGTAVPDSEVLESTTVTETTTIIETTTYTKVEMASVISTTEPKEKSTIATTKTVSSSASKTTQRAENKVTVKPARRQPLPKRQ